MGEDLVAFPAGTPEAVDTDERQQRYQEMVDEAIRVNASRFDMSIPLWRYNLLLSEAGQQSHINLNNVVLDMRGNDAEKQMADFAARNALQVSGSHETCGLDCD